MRRRFAVFTATCTCPSIRLGKANRGYTMLDFPCVKEVPSVGGDELWTAIARECTGAPNVAMKVRTWRTTIMDKICGKNPISSPSPKYQGCLHA